MQKLTDFSWSDAIVREARETESLTVGITNASRTPSDRRTLFELLAALSERIKTQKLSRQVLCVHLSCEEESEDSQTRVPTLQRSVVGNWSNVTIPVSKTDEKTWEEDQLSSWLALWKEAFPIILIDLGAIDSSASREIGRFTDANYLLLGPQGCGSLQWILHQVGRHQQHASSICATLVANPALATNPAPIDEAA
ncbi:MAG: hypothetical protein VXZ82_18040 [Planctomycetota bacterium]|nr:hypothetical protein [Planctomycetota bacterium]